MKSGSKCLKKICKSDKVFKYAPTKLSVKFKNLLIRKSEHICTIYIIYIVISNSAFLVEEKKISDPLNSENF